MEAGRDLSKQVETAIREALHNEALREAVLEFGETRVLLTKGRRLAGAPPDMETPPEYPDVPSRLADEADSWLR